jgi:two-component system, LuxR family, response regulator FixJ
MAAQLPVYVVEDDEHNRSLLVDLLGTVGLAAVPCGSATDFLARFDASRPALLILDVRLPDMSGLELLERLHTLDACVSAIVITGYADVETAVRAVKIGAVEFLQKPCRNQELLERVQQAYQQLPAIWDLHRQRREIRARLESLTPREREVLDLIMAGIANKNIADRLSLSQKTVEFHRAHIMKKLEVDTVVDLANRIFLLRYS